MVIILSVFFHNFIQINQFYLFYNTFILTFFLCLINIVLPIFTNMKTKTIIIKTFTSSFAVQNYNHFETKKQRHLHTSWVINLIFFLIKSAHCVCIQRLFIYISKCLMSGQMDGYVYVPVYYNLVQTKFKWIQSRMVLMLVLVVVV